MSTPAVVGSTADSEFFDWNIVDASEQRAVEDELFSALVGATPEYARRVHFDRSSGYLCMPPRPADAHDEGRWLNAHGLVHSAAESLRGEATRSFVRVAQNVRFRFRHFEPEHWRRLSSLYETLPGWLGGGFDLPRWFGLNEGRPPFLWASVEDFGLEVSGIVLPVHWQGWWDAFLTGCGELPALPGPGPERVPQARKPGSDPR